MKVIMSNRRTLGRGLNSLIPETKEKKNEQRPANNYQQPQPADNKQIYRPKEINRDPRPDEDTNQSNQPTENRVNQNQQPAESRVNLSAQQSATEMVEESQPSDEVVKVSLEEIRPRVDQPRKNFDDEALEELAASISEYGLLNPIVLSKEDGYYQIIAGERRYRASKKLGKESIDAIVRDYSRRDVEVLSLVENVQREDLSALEEANAYKKLADNYGMTQEQIAKTMGKSRSYIANTMRLLNLNDEEKRALNENKISPSQARTLLSITDEESRTATLEDFITGRTNIRNVEKTNRKKSTPKTDEESRTTGPSIDDILIEDLEEKFMDALGSKVNIGKAGKSFKVTIDCFSIEDIESLFERVKE